MNQSTFIAGALLAGFVLFLAARQRLGVYAGVLWGPTNAPTPSGNTQSSSSSGGGGGGNILGSIFSTVLGAIGL